MKAIDLAYSSDRNEEERYRRFPNYKEPTHTSNQARRMIVHLLKDAIDERIPSPSHNSEDCFIRKSPATIKLFAPIAEYSLPRQWKTMAWLERGYAFDKYPSVVAMSGWTHGDEITTVSGRNWTSEVIRIADVIGHVFQPDGRDRGVPGQFHACHAEKQLMAYFISRHVFLKPDEGGPLCQLATAMPPVMLKEAKILITSPPCEDCTRFKQILNQDLDLKISLHQMKEKV